MANIAIENMSGGVSYPYKRAFNDPGRALQYIIVGYEEKYPHATGDELIRDEDVIRTDDNDACIYQCITDDTFYEKSTAKCPTYGVCFNCLCSGPVGGVCHFCENGEYLVMQYRTIDNVDVILDAEWISGTLMKTKHEVALANRRQAWVSTPSTTVDYDFFLKKMMKNFSPTNPTNEKLSQLFYTLFQMGVRNYTEEVIEIYKIERLW